MREDVLPYVSERDARGEIADIFADIRDTLRVPVVNLIWRHFATLDGGLLAAWEALRPIYASGAAEAAGARLLSGLALPSLPAVPAPVLAGAGVAGNDVTTVAAILDTYNRGNAQNLCALSALLAAPGSGPSSVSAVAALPVPSVAIPPMPEMDTLAPQVQALVWQLNALGQPAGDRVLASAWKHLAPWPGFLALSWALLAPLHRDGTLAAAIRDTARAASAEGASLAMLCVGAPAGDAVAAAAREFVERVIVRMVPALQMLRRALPRS